MATVRRAPVLAVVLAATLAAAGAAFAQDDDSASLISLTGAKIIKRYDDGTKVYQLPDGAKVTIFVDGSKRLVRDDGTMIEEWPDGNRRITLPNGTKTSIYPTGKKKTIHPDGSETMVFEDGSRKEVRADGTQITTFADGQTLETAPDGTRTYTFPDGSQRVKAADGTITEVFATGMTRVKQADGTILESWPTGKKRITYADGTKYETVVIERDEFFPEKLVLDGPDQTARPGGKHRVEGVLAEGYSNPWIAYMTPKGTVEFVAPNHVKTSGRQFSTAFPLKHGPGVYRIEIMLVGPWGNTVGANYRVFAGVEETEAKPRLYRLIERDVSSHDLEKRFFDLVNQARLENGLSKLPWDESVARIARDHALDMKDNRFIGHVSPTWGNLGDRAEKKFGWTNVVWGAPTVPGRPGAKTYLGDTISASGSLEQSLDELMESPVHRATLLNRHVDRGGVGIVWAQVDGLDTILVVAALAQVNEKQGTGPRAQTPPRTTAGVPGRPSTGSPLGDAPVPESPPTP